MVNATTRPLYPPGKTRWPLYRRLGGPQGRSGRMRKISPSPGFDPRTVQPVASRYADCYRDPDYRSDHWNYFLTQSSRSHYGPGVDSASNRNEYQQCFLGGKGGQCVVLTTSPLSSAGRLEIWGASSPCSPNGRSSFGNNLRFFLSYLRNLSQTFLVRRKIERDMVKNV